MKKKVVTDSDSEGDFSEPIPVTPKIKPKNRGDASKLNEWLKHVKETKDNHKCSYRDALEIASKTFKK